MINLLPKCAACGVSLEHDLYMLCEICEEIEDSLDHDLDDYESEDDYD